ncbi:30S ribosomal protein S7 [candidate division WWE3 bacterium]|nr:30S ribosomal protein S7 [candidate division WWE3 bacterium]
MPRSKLVRRKVLQPDERYQDIRVTKFINYVMRDGKKDKAKTIVYGALDVAAEKAGMTPSELFEKALMTIRPEVEVRPRRVGGATYQIPVPVSKSRGEAMAMRWMIQAADERSGRPMEMKLAEELVNAIKNEGDAIKKRENMHKMAEANRAFAHFKW